MFAAPAYGNEMRVAIVHDWLARYAGSERVLERLLRLFPNADLHAVVDFLPSQERSFLQGKTPRTTFIQHLPFARRKFRIYLPLMPLAIEQHDMSGYDLVVSSSHAVAKGVLTGPDQVHVSYVHTPMRYAWEQQHHYLRDSGLHRGIAGAWTRHALQRLRAWDFQSAARVDHLIANSTFVAKRIEKTYRRHATVVHPPVDVDAFPLSTRPRHDYVTASRLVPYKRVDLVIRAFAERPRDHLHVIGEGPDRGRLERIATRNVHFHGHLPQQDLASAFANARAFVYAAEEDFGITLVEAQATGTPVIAYGRGGARDSVRPLELSNPTGVYFHEQHPQAIDAAITTFERNVDRFDPATLRAHAERFRPERFDAGLLTTLHHALHPNASNHFDTKNDRGMSFETTVA